MEIREQEKYHIYCRLRNQVWTLSRWPQFEKEKEIAVDAKEKNSGATQKVKPKQDQAYQSWNIQ